MKNTKLTRMQLINWYGFRNEIIEFDGTSTYITGGNQSGKSTMIDAFRYAAYGATEFNVASASREVGTKKRTVSTYTRGFINAADGEMRPASKFSTVHTHIAIEFYDPNEEEFFVNETMIVTNSSNRHETTRYLFNDKKLEDIHFFSEDPEQKTKYMLTKDEFEDTNQAVPMNKQEGLATFFVRTGLHMNYDNIKDFERIARNTVAYNPEMRIKEFIESNILVKKDVDFARLKIATEDHKKTKALFDYTCAQIQSLEDIVAMYDKYKRQKARLIRGTIKRAYRNYLTYKENLESAEREKRRFELKINDLDAKIERYEEEKQEALNQLAAAQADLYSIDVTKSVDMQRSIIDSRESKLIEIRKSYKTAEAQSRQISACAKEIDWLESKEREILDDVLKPSIPLETRTVILEEVKERAEKRLEKINEELNFISLKRNKLIEERNKIEKDIRSIEERTFIPREAKESLELKELINKELQASGHDQSAKMAYEYVEGIIDEEWRPVLENYLNFNRFTVLVEPEDYDIAYEVQIRTGKGSLGRIHSLAEREIETDPKYLSSQLVVPNMIARKFFDYHLRLVMADDEHVRDHDRAISKNGFLSQSMQTRKMRMYKDRNYCLGMNALQITKENLKEQRKVVETEINECKMELDRVNSERILHNDLIIRLSTVIDSIDLSIKERIDEEEDTLKKDQQRLNDLIDMQKKDPDYMKLQEEKDLAQKNLNNISETIKKVDNERSKILEKRNETKSTIRDCKKSLEGDGQSKRGLISLMDENMREYPDLTKQAMKEYDEFLQTGRSNYNVISDATREGYEKEVDATKQELQKMQAQYCADYEDLSIGIDKMNQYIDRLQVLNITEFEEVRNRMDRNKKEWLTIFKFEIIRGICAHIDEAMEIRRKMNSDLKRFGFTTVYSFVFKEISDGSFFEKICKYGRQMTGFQETFMKSTGFVSEEYKEDERAEVSEEEITKIIESIIESGDYEQYQDYRNYMTYDIYMEGPDHPNGAKLSEQVGYNSGAGTQIPYTIILVSALNSRYEMFRNYGPCKLIMFDEAFEKLDETNVNVMLSFLENLGFQAIYSSGSKLNDIGNACNKVLTVCGSRDDMRVLSFSQNKKRGIF